MATTPSTEAIDKLFLELSQFTQASTARELKLSRAVVAARANELQGQLNDLSRLAEDRALEIAGLTNQIKALQGQVDNFKKLNQEAVDLSEFRLSEAIRLGGVADEAAAPANSRATDVAKMSKRIHSLCDENADLRKQLASVLNQTTNQLRDSECNRKKLTGECDDHLKEIKALNAKIECLKRDVHILNSCNVAFASSAGWQPIETAPKDGTYILIRQRSDDSPVGFNAHVCKHDATFPHLPWTTSYGMILGTNPNAPVTHWMPLPPAPGSPGPAAGSSHSEAVARLIAAFESALMIKPHLWFEIGYTSPTDWMVHIWDKSRSQSEGKKIIETQGPIEAACNHARAKLEDYIFKPAS